MALFRRKTDPFKEIQTCLRKRDYKGALTAFKALIEKDPKNTQIRLRYADTLVLAGKKKDAIRQYRKAADERAEAGFMIQAIAINKKIVQLDPSQAGVHEKLAEMNEKSRAERSALPQVVLPPREASPPKPEPPAHEMAARTPEPDHRPPAVQEPAAEPVVTPGEGFEAPQELPDTSEEPTFSLEESMAMEFGDAGAEAPSPAAEEIHASGAGLDNLMGEAEAPPSEPDLAEALRPEFSLPEPDEQEVTPDQLVEPIQERTPVIEMDAFDDSEPELQLIPDEAEDLSLPVEEAQTPSGFLEGDEEPMFQMEDEPDEEPLVAEPEPLSADAEPLAFEAESEPLELQTLEPEAPLALEVEPQEVQPGTDTGPSLDVELFEQPSAGTNEADLADQLVPELATEGDAWGLEVEAVAETPEDNQQLVDLLGDDIDSLIDSIIDDVGSSAAGGNVDSEQPPTHIQLFSDLTMEEFLQVTLMLVRRPVKAGSVIFKEGEPGESMFIVSTGEVDAQHRHRGRMEKVATFREGDFFGEMALLSGEPRKATVTATRNTELLELGRDNLTTLFSRHPEIEAKIRLAYDERIMKLGIES